MANSKSSHSHLYDGLVETLVGDGNYPQLKSDQNSADLQAQLEARKTASPWPPLAILKPCGPYNLASRSFPLELTAMMSLQDTVPILAVENEAASSKPPVVAFAPASRAQPATPSGTATALPPATHPPPACAHSLDLS